MTHWSKDSFRLITFIISLAATSALFTSLLFIYTLPLWMLLVLLISTVLTLLVHPLTGAGVLVAMLVYCLMIAPPVDLSGTAALLVAIASIGVVGWTILISRELYATQLARRIAEEKVRQLIAVDPETWLDNGERFRMDVEAERDRLIRHGGTFVVSFIRLPELVTFEKTHGRTEYEWFLNFFSDELHEATRRTDKKYRISTDTFAIIFPQTSLENAQLVHERMKPLLAVYELQSGEPMTFTCADQFFEVNFENSVTAVEAILRSERDAHVDG